MGEWGCGNPAPPARGAAPRWGRTQREGEGLGARGWAFRGARVAARVCIPSTRHNWLAAAGCSEQHSRRYRGAPVPLVQLGALAIQLLQVLHPRAHLRGSRPGQGRPCTRWGPGSAQAWHAWVLAHRTCAPAAASMLESRQCRAACLGTAGLAHSRQAGGQAGRRTHRGGERLNEAAAAPHHASQATLRVGDGGGSVGSVRVRRCGEQGAANPTAKLTVKPTIPSSGQRQECQAARRSTAGRNRPAATQPSRHQPAAPPPAPHCRWPSAAAAPLQDAGSGSAGAVAKGSRSSLRRRRRRLAAVPAAGEAALWAGAGASQACRGVGLALLAGPQGTMRGHRAFAGVLKCCGGAPGRGCGLPGIEARHFKHLG